MQINDFRVDEENGERIISAWVADERVWFALPIDVPSRLAVEPFLAVALLEAMYQGEDIQIDKSYQISTQVAESLEDLQSIFHCWNPELKIIKIDAATSTQRQESNCVGSFYSAGVDGSSTLLRHFDEITDLILMDVFDGDITPQEWKVLVENQRAFLSVMGKRLLSIRTNARKFAEKRLISWDFMHGLVISSIGSFFNFSKLYVPSSHTYRELFPWGSHPLTDPMWSSESTRVVHEGAGLRRWEKVKEITQSQQMLDNLHVCWRTKIGNCGECPKCIRTMVALEILGARSNALPKYSGTHQLSKLKAMDDHGAVFLSDAMEAAKNRMHKNIHRRLWWYQKQYQLLGLIEHFDRSLLGGTLRKLYRALRKPDWLQLRVALGPKAEERF